MKNTMWYRSRSVTAGLVTARMEKTMEAAPPHPRPGHQQNLPQAAAEGPQNEGHGDEPGQEGEKQGHRQGRGGHGGQLGGEGEQAQQEEQHHLHKPRGPVKEVHQGLFAAQGLVAQENPGEVDAEIAVAPQQGGGGVGRQGHGHHEDGVEALRGKAEPPEKDLAHQGDPHPEGRPEEKLGKDLPGKGAALGLAGHQGQDDHREHVGEGVVAAALHLQQGGGVFPQAQVLGAEDGEHRGSVGGADDRPQQKALQLGQAQDLPGKQAHQPGGEDRAQGGEEHGLSRHGSGLLPVGAEAAVKHNEDEGQGADVLGHGVVVEGDLHHPVRAEEHTQQNEGQQGGHPQPAGHLVAQHAGEDDDGGHEKKLRQREAPPGETRGPDARGLVAGSGGGSRYIVYYNKYWKTRQEFLTFL